jgi:PAS domain S-box-containing protein
MNKSKESIGLKKLQMADLIFREVSDAIMITNMAGDIIDVNPAFTKITEYSRDGVVGNPPRFMHSDCDDGLDYQALLTKLARTDVWSGTVTVNKKSGEPYTAYMTIMAVKNSYEQTTHHIAFLRATSFLLS